MEPTESAAAGIPLRQILIVDPDEGARLLYREALDPSGCEVMEAADGRDALTKALMRAPALVVTELRLPLLDGMSLCEILRSDRTTADVPILVITAEAGSETIARARQIADGVLSKPASPDSVGNECTRLMVRAAASGAGSRALLAGTATPPPRPADGERPVLAKSLPRFSTTTPPAAPPLLTCPACDRPLKYERSHVGGVSERHREQWDYYTCLNCGTFQYRQRTRRVRLVD